MTRWGAVLYNVIEVVSYAPSAQATCGWGNVFVVWPNSPRVRIIDCLMFVISVYYTTVLYWVVARCDGDAGVLAGAISIIQNICSITALVTNQYISRATGRVATAVDGVGRVRVLGEPCH